MSVALAADIRIAAETARFGVTPAKLGLVYPVRDTERLVQAVGMSQAKDILFTGDIFSAARALRIGLADELCAPGTALIHARQKADAIASVAPSAVRSMKEIINAAAQGQAPSPTESRALFVKASTSADFREGFRAFLEKRSPRFPGV